MTKQSSYLYNLRTGSRHIGRWFGAYWRKNAWHKVCIIVVAAGLICFGIMYGIARWYIASQAGRPLVYGTTFIAPYAESLGLEPKETMQALIDDAGVRHFRLVSYWDQLEPSPGRYDFTQLDWQFEKAEAAHAKVTLGLGLRQPRWPECHMPSWAIDRPASDWQPRMQQFIAAVVDRYKNSPSLESYQLENEFFLKGFGTCTNHDRQRLVAEFKLVKARDPHHKLIITRSNNALGAPLGQPRPDEFGISIYKRVWDAAFTRRYLEYPFPAWYYAFLAGSQKLLTGRDMVIHEMQAEAWPPHGQAIAQTSLAEQNKSLNAKRLQGRFEHARATGMRTIDMWGGEYWYYRLKVENDPSLWNVARQEFGQTHR